MERMVKAQRKVAKLGAAGSGRIRKQLAGREARANGEMLASIKDVRLQQSP
jgi:hypothetical protein